MNIMMLCRTVQLEGSQFGDVTLEVWFAETALERVALVEDRRTLLDLPVIRRRDAGAEACHTARADEAVVVVGNHVIPVRWLYRAAQFHPSGGPQ